MRVPTRSVAGPSALRRLELRDAESPEDVEPTLFVLDLFQDGMRLS